MGVDLVQNVGGTEVLDGVLQLCPRHTAETELLGVGASVLDDAEEAHHQDGRQQGQFDADVAQLGT